jgi:general L-amino acid transport system substrate-binding protein
MWKRLAALLAVLALVAAACGGTDEGEDTTSTTAADTATTTTAATGGGDGGQASGEGTLAEIIARDKLLCGVSGTAVAFSETQPDGSTTGFDADYCRGLAAAILGDASKVEFRALTAAQRFEALNNKEIDVLIRNTTHTQSRDTDLAMDFAPTTYYDGQQLMGAASKFSVDSGPADVDGAILCTNAGTTTEKNITEWAALGGAAIVLETVEEFPEAMDKLVAGSCDLVTTDGSGLVGNKASREAAGDVAPGTWVIFPKAPISKEPLGPVYRQNDSQFADVVNWLVWGMVIADEKGITKDNIDSVEWDPEATRLFGGEGELQTKMGLPADAYYQAIKQVGNYNDVYVANLGPVGLTREGSFNDYFFNGGMQYAPPAR